ncbi:piggyBac transposable element-derived protein 4-like [Vespula squamosa]|uniref:PiggyBac transposable element-derived protein 4-like n=1 Tax=Vespula squamosa TaxID=30214 RepID=A0ABD2B9M8_VESSQ
MCYKTRAAVIVNEQQKPDLYSIYSSQTSRISLVQNSGWPTKLITKRTSLVDTIRQNKKELPKLVKSKKDHMPHFSIILYKTENCTLTIYKSKSNKNALLLNLKHKSVKIKKDDKLLPEIVVFCNNIKFNVDMTDQMVRKYTVKAGSRRWQILPEYMDIIQRNNIFQDKTSYFNKLKNLQVTTKNVTRQSSVKAEKISSFYL